ncbi:MAG: hypothetical protein JNM27_16860, partial [Leptospirales bacterium]|nr:hypothetical protein [Leptospirales bacterium]
MIELAQYCAILFITITGLGFGVCFLLNHTGKLSVLRAQWSGFIALIVLLEFWSIFLPVNNRLGWLVLGLSLPGLFLMARHFLRSQSTSWRSLVVFTLAAFLPILFAVYTSCKLVTWYDTPLYHLNAVRWINEFAAIPGLANFHERLGFNSSFLLFGALTNVDPLAGKAAHIALPYLLCMTLCEVIW